MPRSAKPAPFDHSLVCPDVFDQKVSPDTPKMQAAGRTLVFHAEPAPAPVPKAEAPRTAPQAQDKANLTPYHACPPEVQNRCFLADPANHGRLAYDFEDREWAYR